MQIKAKHFILLSFIIFLISLSQKTYGLDHQPGEYWGGFMAFTFGAFGLLGGGFVFLTWLANPFLVISWFTFKKNPRISLITSSIALVFGITFLLFDEILKNSAGHHGIITSYGLGYFLWMLSMLIMIFGSVFKLNLSDK